MAEKSIYWVRSKQTAEISGFGRKPVPAQFKTFGAAKIYCRDLNLHRGAYHPGYFVEKQDDSPLSFPLDPGYGDHKSLNNASSGEVMSLQITSRMVSGVVVVDVFGKLCFLQTALREHIYELLQEGHLEFVLNLKDVPYVDSFGLGQLITVWTAVRTRGGQLVLLRPTDHVQTLFEITRLNSVFHVSGEETQAIKTVRANGATSGPTVLRHVVPI
jgi:anti-sigma B factor antagonist